jgi:hypothetical protein
MSGSTGITSDCSTLKAIAAAPSIARVRPGDPLRAGRTAAEVTSSTALQGVQARPLARDCLAPAVPGILGEFRDGIKQK